MKNKQQTPTPIKIWLFVPELFLQEFDTQIQHAYSSRNEAIRHGMKLITQEINNHHHKTPPNQPLTQPNTPLTIMQLHFFRQILTETP